MNKKFLIPTMVLTAGFLAAGVLSSSTGAAGVARTPSINNVGVKRVNNAASSWVCSNGASDVLTATDVEGGVKISNLHAYSAEMRTVEEVTLDGLSFTFTNEGATTAAAGFYFSQDTEFAWTKPTFTIWHALYGSQTRFNVTSSHDYNEDAVVYTAPSPSAATGFGVASSMVMNALDNDGVNMTFEHVSFSWWKVTIREVFASSFWGSNANYVKGEDGYATVTTYIRNVDMPVDENGQAYMHVVGASNAGGTVYVKDFVDGSYREVPQDPATDEERAAAKAQLDAVITADFPASIQSEIDSLRTAAAAEIDAKTYASEFEAVIASFNEAVHHALAVCAKYDTPIDSEDLTANYYPCWGQEFYARRLDNRGGVTINMTCAYGARGELLRQYDYSNLELTVNLYELPVSGALFINFDIEQQSFYDSPTKKYTIEFLRVDATNILVVLGNTNAHNISIEEWAEVNRSGYTGRLITTTSGTINIKVESADGQTTFTANGTSATFASTLINKGEALAANPKSYVQIGGLNNANRLNVPFEKIEDADSKAYADSLEATVNGYKAGITTAVETAMAAVPEGGINTDADYAAYANSMNAAIETISQASPLTSYDEAYYGIGEFKAQARATLDAPLATYTAAIEAAKAEVIAIIDSYKAEDYREEDTYVLAAAQASYKDSVEKATSLTGIAEIRAQAIEGLNAIPTDAQLTLAEKKVAAKDEITNYVKLEDYRDGEMATVLQIINTAKTDIDAAETLDAVDAVLAEAKAAIDLVKTDAQLTAEEAAKALAEAKANAKAELESHVKAEDYRDAEKAQITTIVNQGKAAIDAATDVAGVTAALNDAKAKLDALKTNADYVAEEEAKALADAKTAAKAEIEGYIASMDDYDENGKASIESIIASTKTAIDEATSIDAVNAAVAEAKTSLDGVAKKAKGCGGSIVTGASLVGMIGFLGLAIAAKRKKEN